MSLEGRIRDLGLHEVCQLLGIGRKTGALRLRAPLTGMDAEVRVVHGSIVDAAAWPSSTPCPLPSGVTDSRALVETVLSLMAWTDGEFRFVSAEPASFGATSLRVSMDAVLVEAAQRAEVWERVQDRIPHANVIPAFVELEAHQLPLLRLAPQEWEVLTRVDGARTLTELAVVLGRDLLDVATIVHGLIGAGLLLVRATEGATVRRHATPPSSAAIADDLWIPGDDTDPVFDPLLEQLSPPREATLGDDGSARGATGLATVASAPREPSLQENAERARAWCRDGDAAARQGDLTRALDLWSRALASRALTPDRASRVEDAVAAAARLQALLASTES